METQTKLKIMLLTVAALGLVACRGGGTSGSTELSSRASSTTDTTKAWVKCNVDQSTSNLFEIRLAAVIDAGSIRNDLMYIRLGRAPSDFATSGDYIQFFRWQANTANVYLDPTPINFEVWDPTSGQQILGSRASLRWSDLQTAATSLGFGSDPVGFFRRVRLFADIRDPSANFDALKTALYTSSNALRDQSDALLPVFAANPEHYQTDTDGSTRNQALMNLHPFLTSIGQGWTTADFEARATSFCSSF